MTNEEVESKLVQKWYREEFGIHDHPDEWSLNIARRAHDFCHKIWIEKVD